MFGRSNRKASGSSKTRSVTVGRSINHRDRFTFGNGPSVQRDIARRGTRKPAIGRIQPQKLFHRSRDATRIIAQQLLKIPDCGSDARRCCRTKVAEP